MREWSTFEVVLAPPVATIKIPSGESRPIGPTGDIHQELGEAVTLLADSLDIRVIVITGEKDGEFYVPPAAQHASPKRHRLTDRVAQRVAVKGIAESVHAFLEAEVPIIARVNGDAIGFGQSVLFMCDFVLARADAIISDCHMGQATTSTGVLVGTPIPKTPGDGAGALLPLYLSPAKAKEYLMFSRALTAADLVDAGVFNRAVPMDRLDDEVDAFVRDIVSRPRQPLARTKRIVNRRLVEQANLVLDLSTAYEIMDIYDGVE